MGAGSRYREVHSRGVPEEHLFEPIRVLRRHGELLRGDGHIAVVDGERVVGARVQLRVRVRDGRRAVAEDVLPWIHSIVALLRSSRKFGASLLIRVPPISRMPYAGRASIDWIRRATCK